MLLPIAATLLLLSLEIAATRLRGRSLRSAPTAAVWAAVLSVFLWTAVERLNVTRPVWANLGWPPAELTRYLALGWLHATVLPTLLLLVDLLGGFSLQPPPRTLRWAPAVALVGGGTLAAALIEQVPGSAAMWFVLGLVGLWVASDAWNLAAGEPAVISSSPQAFWAMQGAAVLWASFTILVSRYSSAQRFWIIGDSFLIPAALLALASMALLAAYRLVARLAGLPIYPSDERSGDALHAIDLSSP